VLTYVVLSPPDRLKRSQLKELTHKLAVLRVNIKAFEAMLLHHLEKRHRMEALKDRPVIVNLGQRRMSIDLFE
jgi:hypothetical protein